MVFSCILNADAKLLPLGDKTVHCVVTSPPYWGLRDYGLAPLEWPEVSFQPMPGLDPLTIPQMTCCHGLEPDPWSFIGHEVLIFRGVRRVLRDDGTIWVNMGDGYASGGRGGGGLFMELRGERSWGANKNRKGWKSAPPGWKNKDLLDMPWRVALALQADGWYLRQDIIWHKPNPMPESVTDRCTKAHEYVFLLSKSASYYYDAEAIKEEASDTGRINGQEGRDEEAAARPPGTNPRTLARIDYTGVGRNKRSVWTIPTQSYKGAHFATFPEKLVEPCILAGTSAKGCCPICGTGWVRIIAKGRRPTRSGKNSKVRGWGGKDGRILRRTEGRGSRNGDSPYEDHAGLIVGNRDPERHCTVSMTTGWRPGCKCVDSSQFSVLSSQLKPAVVLDPFSGSGTTLAVALRLGRSAVGTELNGEYIGQGRQRTGNVTPPLFAIG